MKEQREVIKTNFSGKLEGGNYSYSKMKKLREKNSRSLKTQAYKSFRSLLAKIFRKFSKRKTCFPLDLLFFFECSELNESFHFSYSGSVKIINILPKTSVAFMLSNTRWCGMEEENAKL